MISSRLRLFAGDVTGGVMAALVAIPQAVPFGIMVFAPLGVGYLWLGVASGLISGIVGSLVCVLFSPIKVQICGPRAATAIVLATLVSVLAADPLLQVGGSPHVPSIFILICGTVVLAGGVQLAFGRLAIGQSVKLIPYPVLTGFLLGLAVLLIWRQIPAMAGQMVGQDSLEVLRNWTKISPGAIIILCSTVLAIALSVRYWPNVPSIAVGFVAGWAVFLVLQATIGYENASSIAMPVLHFPLISSDAQTWPILAEALTHRELLATLVLYMGLVAVVSSIESLLSLVSFDAMASSYSDSNRELAAQGFSNIAAGLAGGITSVAATVRTLTNQSSGGNSPISVLVHSIVLGAMLFYSSLIATIPQAVLAGIMLHVALNMVDWWPWRLVQDVLSPSRRRKGQFGTLAVVLLTAVVTVGFDSLTAVGIGVVLSIAVFVRDMSRPIMRRVWTGASMRSRIVRTGAASEALVALAGRTTITQLDGPLFFGTADAVRKWAESIDPARTQQVIIDVSRLIDIDLTGAHILLQTTRRLADKGIGVAIAGLPGTDSRRQQMVEFGLDGAVNWFDDLDHALEWAEDRLLGTLDPMIEAVHIPPSHSSLLAGLLEEERAVVEGLLAARSVSRDDVLFDEGEIGEELYLLSEGTVRIELHRAGRPIRLSTISPGVIFGEMALLDNKPRSATAVVDTAGVIHALSRANIAVLQEKYPQIASRLMHNIAREIAQRLRTTNAIVLSSSDN